MLLRDVEPADLDAYVRMRCDPVMMSQLGGPQPRKHIAAQLTRDLETVREDSAWIKMRRTGSRPVRSQNLPP